MQFDGIDSSEFVANLLKIPLGFPPLQTYP